MAGTPVGALLPVTVDVISTPTIALGTVSDYTRCTSPDGKIQLTGLDGTSLYDIFYSEDGSSTSQTGLLSDASGSLTIKGLFVATYTNIYIEISGTDDATNQISTATVADLTDVPVITIGAVSVSKESGESTADGSINASGNAVTGGSGNYYYKWYAGTDTSSPLDESSSVLSGLTAGNYTLKIVDAISGCSVTDSFLLETEETLGLFNNSNSDLFIYPNPAKAHFNVDISEYILKSLSILNIDGRVVRKFNSNGPYKIEGLQNGMCILVLESSNNKSINEKLLIQK
ncbi:MAG: T9SS type A sorting domain-containing protein [Cytophagales bacterium]|nr:T9SS type A sorting domain-containing protein [Cytophagales bacterium]